MSETLPALIRKATDLAFKLSESGGEITPDIELELDQTGQALSQKADAYGFVLESLAAQKEIAKKRIDEWTAYYAALGRAEDNVENRMKHGLISMDITEISGEQSTFRLQANNPTCVIDDQSKIPTEFIVVVRPEPVLKVLKAEITKAIKDGNQVAGAHLERTVRLIHKVGKRLK